MSIDTSAFEAVHLDPTQEDLTRQKRELRKLKEQKRKDKARFNRMLDARPTTIHEDFWDQFILLAKACYYNNEEADVYDVFDTLRVYKLGGWAYKPEYLDKLDEEIDREYGRSRPLS